MSNLIITIISIALVAIVAIVGIFYGGAAFENAQAKGIADAIANQAMQLNNAAIQYQTDHATGFLTAVSAYCGGGAPAGCGDPITPLLVPAYLQTGLPVDPANWGGQNAASKLFTANQWEISGSDNWGTLSSGSNATYGYFLWLYANWPTSSTIIQTCKQIAIMVRGQNAVPFANTAWRVMYQPGMNPTLDCMWEQMTGSGYTTIDQCQGNSNCWIHISAQINASF